VEPVSRQGPCGLTVEGRAIFSGIAPSLKIVLNERRSVHMKRPLISRRTFLKTGAGATAGALGWNGQLPAIGPIDRSQGSEVPLKLSLAAYSLRQYLPNYRRGEPTGGEPLDMFGFLEYCARIGLDGAEITSYFLPHPCPGTLAINLKRQAHLLGLGISGGAIGNNFAQGKGEAAAEQMAYTEEWIKTYAAMGAPVIRVFGGKPSGEGAGEEAAEENIIHNMTAACEIAGRHGVILAIENHDFLTDIHRLLRIVEAVDSPWFGVNFDSGNLGMTADPYGDLAKLAPYAVNAQLKVHLPRNGVKEEANFERLVGLLREAGYRGYIVLEYEDKPDPYEAIPPLVERLRSLMG
jgi:sugar phosphate isomerase/epimerase